MISFHTATQLYSKIEERKKWGIQISPEVLFSNYILKRICQILRVPSKIKAQTITQSDWSINVENVKAEKLSPVVLRSSRQTVLSHWSTEIEKFSFHWFFIYLPYAFKQDLRLKKPLAINGGVPTGLPLSPFWQTCSTCRLGWKLRWDVVFNQEAGRFGVMQVSSLWSYRNLKVQIG